MRGGSPPWLKRYRDRIQPINSKSRMDETAKAWLEKEKEAQQKRTYLHFDQKSSLGKAQKFVTNPAEVGRHYFYPFIKNTLVTPRFKKDKDTGERKWEKKEREIMYASHVDTLIYSYYNLILSEQYKLKLEATEFESSAIAYRKLGKSNIDFAYEVFQEIADFGECVVLAFDVSDFFPGLDHDILKRSWEYMMDFDDGLENHQDHYNVFKSLTRFAYVEKEKLDTILNIKEKRREGKKAFRYCSGKEFREKVRGNKLIRVNEEPKGIPQGSPISALLSNIYMFDFDKKLYDKVCKELGGIYRRYSDDIIVVCKPEAGKDLEAWIKKVIDVDFKLIIQDKKTEKFSLETEIKGILRPINIRTGKRQNVQYLGFEYDGENIFIRSSSVSRYYRRMKRSVHVTVKKALRKGDNKVFRKKLLMKNTDEADKLLTDNQRKNFRGNFITYAKRASAKMNGNKKILNQIKLHKKKLKDAIDKKGNDLSEKQNKEEK